MRVPVAIKQVVKRDNGVIQRFMLREKEAIRRVRGHPNVVELYEVFEDSEYIYFVQDYIAGGTLKQRLKVSRRSGSVILQWLKIRFRQVSV